MSTSPTSNAQEVVVQALALLKETSWFHDAPNSLLQALAGAMRPVQAPDAHLFYEESEVIDSVLILEQGTLTRTKSIQADDDDSNSETSTSTADGGGAKTSPKKTILRHLSLAERQQSMGTTSVLVDKISGRGRITGLLHNVNKQDSIAFATVVALGPAKVWLIEGEDFRNIIASPPEHSLAVMVAMARELRVGSKSLRGTMKNIRKSDSQASFQPGTKIVKVLCYDTTSWVSQGFAPAIKAFNAAHKHDKVGIHMQFTTERLSEQSATYAAGYDAVCCFVNDNASSAVLQVLSSLGVCCIAMRCAGFDRVDTRAASAFGLTICRVPAYSPYAVAEMAIALLMSLNRKIHKSLNRVKMANFTLDAGLMGVDVHGKTVGVMGTGKIGQILCNILVGFGANLICNDVYESDAVKTAGGVYVSKEEILKRSDILFLMMPLLEATHHTINEEALSKLKKGVLLINTSRGGLVDTKALLKGLRTGVIGGIGMDVYENEQEYFFRDWSAKPIQDTDLVALLGHNDVVLTAHQAFFTKEAVDKIVSGTLDNLFEFQNGRTGRDHPNNCIPVFKD